MYCKFCNKECKNKISLSAHEIRCKLNPNKIDTSNSNFIQYHKRIKNNEIPNENEVKYCKFCNKECKNNNSLRQHETRCKLNPNKIDLSYVKSNFIEYNKKVKNGDIIKKYNNQYDKANKLGYKVIISNETRKKLSISGKKLRHTIETRQKISNSMKMAVKKYPESYNGTFKRGYVKPYDYNGIRLLGTWEVNVAKYLDKLNIEWIKPNKGIEYEWNNSIHLYYPDFYLPKYDKYIEVKGYKIDRDNYKWNVLSNLIIIEKDLYIKILKKLNDCSL